MRRLRQSVLAAMLVAVPGCAHAVAASPQAAGTSPDAGLLLGLLIVGVYCLLLVARRGG